MQPSMTVAARKKFGKAVREARERLELSQERAAELAHIHRTYMGGIERGERNPSLINILAIAKALQVSPVEFFMEFTEENLKTVKVKSDRMRRRRTEK